MKDSPPQNQPAKAPQGKARRPASGHSKKKRSISPKKRQHSPSKVIKEKPSAPLKSKTLHQSPSARRYPEMSEKERKLAESDAYLRKLNKSSAGSKRPGLAIVQKREKIAQMEREMELSQISSWTGGESQYDYVVKEKEQAKKKQHQNLSEVFRSGMPDREELVDTIVALRTEKNYHDEEMRLLKVSCARLKKQLHQAQEQAGESGPGTRHEWIKHQPETVNGALMNPMDLENSLNENRKLKRTINTLSEQNSTFRVAAEKYQKRAIYVRKKYAMLMAKTKNGGDIASQLSGSGSNTGADDKLRLKCSKLTMQIQKHGEQMEQKEEEIIKLRGKVANMGQLAKFRLEAQKHAKTCEKLTQRLLVLERNELKRKQYEDIRRQLQTTMVIDDQEQAVRDEEDRLAQEEIDALKAEEVARKEQEGLEVEFDEEDAKYQENTAYGVNNPVMGNEDIAESLGMEFVPTQFDRRGRKIGNRSSPFKKPGEPDEFEEDLEDGDQALPEGEDDEAKPVNDDEVSQSSQRTAVSVQNPTKDYVAATLSAWNACPTIVKKQLDKQNDEISELKASLREADVKIQMKKNDFEKQQAATMKKELMKHRENIENIYKRKLEDEKRKLLKQRVDEVDKLVKENKKLNAKIGAKW